MDPASQPAVYHASNIVDLHPSLHYQICSLLIWAIEKINLLSVLLT